MATRTNVGQMILPGLEMAWCRCGCGQSFMRTARGRRKEYINATHKKREARRLAKERTTETRVRLAPLGMLFLRAGAEDEARTAWEGMTEHERRLINALCESGLSAGDMFDALTSLFMVRGVD